MAPTQFLHYTVTEMVIQSLDIGKQIQVLRNAMAQSQRERCAAGQVERA
jgi:hypothetical protein